MWPKHVAAGVDAGDAAGIAGELTSGVEAVGGADHAFDDNGRDVPGPGGGSSGASSRGSVHFVT